MESLLRDVRYALRMLVKSPGFSAVAILTIALGIGATTAVFTVVDAALLRGLPYQEPERLVAIAMTKSGQFGTMEASYPNFLDWRARNRTFSGLAGYGYTFNVVIQSDEGPETVQGTMVSANFFDVLGVRAHLGRTFAAGEDDPKAPRSAVLTYGLWQKRYGGRAEAVGQNIQFRNSTATIIGVLPPDFQFAPTPGSEVYLQPPTQGGLFARRNLHWINVVARLKPEVSQDVARADMESISAALAAEFPDTNKDTGIAMQPLTELIVGQVRPVFLVLLAAVAVLLLIACVNVANLLIARGAVRSREIGVRFALGASRWRLVRQLLTESVIIALFGGVLGVLIAWWGIAALIGAIPVAVLNNMPYLQALTLDLRVLAVTAAVAIFTGLLFGLAPALHLASMRVFESLREGTRGFVSGHRVRDALVIAEVGLALVMLIGAGLLAKSLVRMLDVDPGFNLHNLVTVNVGFPGNKYPQPQQIIALREQFMERIAAQPGVKGVAATNVVPLQGGRMTVRFQVEGQELLSAGEQAEANTRTVTANYFSVLGATLAEGRTFGPQDHLDAPPVVVVNRSLAERYFPNGAVGKRFRFTYAPNLPWIEIVGVVEDINEVNLDQQPRPAIYNPASQDNGSFIALVMRTDSHPAPLIAAVTQEARALDRDTLVFGATTVEQLVGDSQATFLRRYPAILIGVFATVALLLSLIGVYGIIAFSVAQRTREIGVRMALGAQRADVIRLILRDGARIAAIGIAAGLIAALLAARAVSSMLFGVAPTDLPTFVSVPLLIAAIVLAAASVPALRASRVDPMVALRYE